MPKLKEKKIVSPFFGGGSFELCLTQMLNFEVVAYDIFGLLVNFWNVLINNKQEFILELEKFDVTKEEFTHNRQVLLNYWNKVKPKDLAYNTRNKLQLGEKDFTLLDNDNIKQAVYYYYNMPLSYGPMFLGWQSSIEINKERFNRRIEKLKKLNIKNLKIDCLSFEKVLEKHKNDFLFLDPPYYLDGDSKMFKGIYPNSNFAIHHKNFDHVTLSNMLKKHIGGFLLTYNNCSAVKEMYKEYQFVYPKWQYTFGQGETRIGKNRKEMDMGNTKESHEIIIIKQPFSYQ